MKAQSPPLDLFRIGELASAISELLTGILGPGSTALGRVVGYP